MTMTARTLALAFLTIAAAVPLDAQWLSPPSLTVLSAADEAPSVERDWESAWNFRRSQPSGRGFQRTALYASAGSTLGVLAGLMLAEGGYEQQLTAAILGGTTGAIAGAGLAAPHGDLGPLVGIAALGAAAGVAPGVGLALLLPVPALAFGAGQGMTTAAVVHLLR